MIKIEIIPSPPCEGEPEFIHGLWRWRYRDTHSVDTHYAEPPAEEYRPKEINGIWYWIKD